MWNMDKKIEEIKERAFGEIKATKNPEELEKVKIKYLGRKGELTQILRSLKDLPIQKRRKIGPQAQQLKKQLEEKIEEKSKLLIHSPSPAVYGLDITKPGHKIKVGHLHPLSKIEEEIRQIFLSMNFSVVEGPEAENEYYNFDALNIPQDHPARDAWDTFWLKAQIDADRTQKVAEKIPRNSASSQRKSALLLRTHTSPMQIHYMESHQPPFQIVVPGRVFRYEATDASHETTFSQMEGLMVGKDVSLTNFKFIIEHFLKRLFGSKIEFELRPSYYPFTEPSIDVYMKWRGKWLEVAGAGMVHPKVFEAVGYNPYEWQGFAFGFGLNRLAMIKYKIPDIRLFYNGDLRFIRQF
jgi:phenylalanyl-tRNA synthetase alpha chain